MDAAASSLRALALGIDLGTSAARVGIFDDEGVWHVVANTEGNLSTPCYIAFGASGAMVGEAAELQALVNLKNTVFEIKRLMGRKFWDPELQIDMARWPFTVLYNAAKPMVQVDLLGVPTRFSPEHLTAILLDHLKEAAEAHLEFPVVNAVISVPGFSTTAQRQAIKDAGVISGLNVLRVINDTDAAALQWTRGRCLPGEHVRIYYGIGGGTVDVAILLSDGDIHENVSIAGNCHLGGEDLTTRLVSFYAKLFQERHAKDIMTDPRAVRRLRLACERAKCTLSTATSTTVAVDHLVEDIDLNETLTRQAYEEICDDLFQLAVAPVKKALKLSRFLKSDISDVIVFGAASKTPRIRQLLGEMFDGKALDHTLEDDAVARGASLLASILTGRGASTGTQDLLLLTSVVRTLRIETGSAGGVVLHGGAVTRGTTPIIPRMACTPTRKTECFTTVTDNQASVRIRVFEGEADQASGNAFIGELVLDGIHPSDQGVPRIDVTLDYVNGIISLRATDTASATSVFAALNDDGRANRS